ncbi:MAG: hypothetical protein IIZ38_05185 [Sphingomonas sp.]|uniref:hypothetical protein n=1 Tax=Sphingomonas sp. TaxID=28214 RepID=UPI0025E8DEF0|nr:hypothetical protein [Sphingomonas sp.]MBQ1497689.1 hypothetical protein [Sphingomonas sp.]MBQ8102779.1 hypothetical protein [Afipia sp.]
MANSLQGIILPVFEAVPDSHIKNDLARCFSEHSHYFHAIENGFRALTRQRQDPEALCAFFHSWSQTNNSAVTVAGIGNRLTLLLHRGQHVGDEAALLRALTSLDRIIDEDLAVTHRVLHADMFYRMATDIVGDDRWLSRRYLHPAAEEFKDWKDHNSLRERDHVIALLTTLAHEIYTHGEVEFILPLFRRWLAEEYGFTDAAIRQTLAWISVHTGPTEKNHFFYALSALQHFAEATGVTIADYSLDDIVSTYLAKKAAVLDHVCLRDAIEVEAVH